MNPQNLLQSDNLVTTIIKQLFGGYLNNEGKQTWDSYTYNRNFGTTNTFLKQKILNASKGLLGPGAGGLVGTLFGNMLVPDDLQTGRLSSFGQDFISNRGQTFSNNIMNYTDAVYRRTRNKDDKNIRSVLNRQFYRAYYDLTMQGRSDKQRNDAVENAMKSQPLSLPFWAKTLIDPTQIERTVQNISQTQKDIIQKQRRRNPLGTDSLKRAKNLGSKVLQMSMQANSRALGITKGKDGKDIASYAGFTAGAVSQLSKVLAEATDVVGGNLPQGELENSLQKFKEKVQKTTKALMPLRDVFGQDIKAMVTTLQAVSNQPIGRLSQQRIKSISGQIAQVMRANPGLSAGDIAKSGQALQALGARYGLSQTGVISMGQAGIRYAGFMSDNTLTPWGMTRDYYRGQVGKDMVSAEASQDKERSAQAYAVWAQYQKARGEDYSLDTFKKLQRQSIREGKSTQQFIFGLDAMKGITNLSQLQQRAYSSGFYKIAKTADFSDVGMQAQIKNSIQENWRRVQQNRFSAGADKNKVMDFILNSKDPAAINRALDAQDFASLSAADQKRIGTEANFRAIQIMANSSEQFRQRAITHNKSLQTQEAKEQSAFLAQVLNGEDGGGSTTFMDIYKKIVNKATDGTQGQKNVAARMLKQFNTILGDKGINALKNKSATQQSKYSMLMKTGLKQGMLGDSQFRDRFNKALTADTKNKQLADAELLTYVMANGDRDNLKKLQDKLFEKDSKGVIKNLKEDGKAFIKDYNDRITAAKEKKGNKQLTQLQLSGISKQMSQQMSLQSAADKWAKENKPDTYKSMSTKAKVEAFTRQSEEGKKFDSKYVGTLVKRKEGQSDQDYAIRRQSLIDYTQATGDPGDKDKYIREKRNLLYKEILGQQKYNQLANDHINLNGSNDTASGINQKALKKAGVSQQNIRRLKKVQKHYWDRFVSKPGQTQDDTQKYITDKYTNRQNQTQYRIARARELSKISDMKVASSDTGLKATLDNLTSVLNALTGFLQQWKGKGSGS